MGRVLVIYYSNSHCTKFALDALVAPLLAANHQVKWHAIMPIRTYPFPWTPPQFFETFPEALAGDLPLLAPSGLGGGDEYDLVILGWQVWFLRPSPPVQAFLKSCDAQILHGRRVLSVVCCRQMWRTAYRYLAAGIKSNGGRLTDHVAVTHSGGSWTLITTPARLMSRTPDAVREPTVAVLDADAMAHQVHIGERIRDTAELWRRQECSSLLGRELPAESYGSNEFAERVGNAYMSAWGVIGRFVGGRETWSRSIAAFVFALLLTLLIPIVLPIGLILSWFASRSSTSRSDFLSASPGRLRDPSK